MSSTTTTNLPSSQGTPKLKSEMVKPSNGHSVTKRLQKELQSLMFSKDKSVSAFPNGSNLLEWTGTITGPAETVYESLTYKLSLSFPSDYPCSAPTVKFVTPCYHPNVDNHGNICLDILKENWSAVYDVERLLRSLQSLLGEPNIDSPLNGHAASLWESQEAYKVELLAHYKKNSKSTSK
eukprot:m.218677 g.218677  ORF g.218677 m.218677 type:complete len:180 (-) comp15905_c1_seq1:101-640(-)